MKIEPLELRAYAGVMVNSAEIFGALLGVFLIIVVPLALGIVLIVLANKKKTQARQRYEYWASQTAPGAPVIDQQTGETIKPKAGTGLLVFGIILVVIAGLFILGQLGGAASRSTALAAVVGLA